MSVIPKHMEDFLDRLRQQMREDDEWARDIDAIRNGTFVEAPEPESGLF